MLSRSHATRLSFVIFIAHALVVSPVRALPVIDHLLPFTQSFDPDLRPIFDKKLVLTPATYGRMIKMHGGPDGKDSVISVYCNDRSMSGAQCYVTLTEAQGNLDHVRANHRGDNDPFRQVRKVLVVRKDARIPKALADAFRDCLRATLPGYADPRVDTYVVLGNDRVEFWLVEPRSPALKAERSDRPGKRISALIRIGDLLGRYAEVPQAGRATLAKQIERDSHWLLNALRR